MTRAEAESAYLRSKKEEYARHRQASIRALEKRDIKKARDAFFGMHRAAYHVAQMLDNGNWKAEASRAEQLWTACALIAEVIDNGQPGAPE